MSTASRFNAPTRVAQASLRFAGMRAGNAGNGGHGAVCPWSGMAQIPSHGCLRCHPPPIFTHRSGVGSAARATFGIQGAQTSGHVAVLVWSCVRHHGRTRYAGPQALAGRCQCQGQTPVAVCHSQTGMRRPHHQSGGQTAEAKARDVGRQIRCPVCFFEKLRRRITIFCFSWTRPCPNQPSNRRLSSSYHRLLGRRVQVVAARYASQSSNHRTMLRNFRAGTFSTDTAS